MFEKAQELGVNLIGVHKGVPLGPQPIEHTRTFDMDGAAANFPDINFVIFHVGLPWLDEVLWQIVRFPNLYASIAATVNFISRQPRVFAEMLGKMMWWCGEDKILYGGEAPIWHPQWALEAFWDFELPEDIVTERGYPQLTDQAKRKILGGNLARLHGIDVEAKSKRAGPRVSPTAGAASRRARGCGSAEVGHELVGENSACPARRRGRRGVDDEPLAAARPGARPRAPSCREVGGRARRAGLLVEADLDRGLDGAVVEPARRHVDLGPHRVRTADVELAIGGRARRDRASVVPPRSRSCC